MCTHAHTHTRTHAHMRTHHMCMRRVQLQTAQSHTHLPEMPEWLIVLCTLKRPTPHPMQQTQALSLLHRKRSGNPNVLAIISDSAESVIQPNQWFSRISDSAESVIQLNHWFGWNSSANLSDDSRSNYKAVRILITVHETINYKLQLIYGFPYGMYTGGCTITS